MSVCVYLHTGEGQRFEAQLLACSDLPQDWKKNISWSGASVSPLTNMGYSHSGSGESWLGCIMERSPKTLGEDLIAAQMQAVSIRNFGADCAGLLGL